MTKNIKSVVSGTTVVNNYLDYLDFYFGISPHEKKVTCIINEKIITKTRAAKNFR
jgi:hypothetical protein